jgi:hypothetical protein
MSLDRRLGQLERSILAGHSPCAQHSSGIVAIVHVEDANRYCSDCLGPCEHPGPCAVCGVPTLTVTIREADEGAVAGDGS